MPWGMYPTPLRSVKVVTTVAVLIAKPAQHALQGFLVAPEMRQAVVSSAANAVKILQQRAALMMQNVARFKQSVAPLQHVVLRKNLEQ